MKDEHPIDDLFARALREAEAAPPPRVWEGVVRERDRTHLLLLHLRRRWGWLFLALLTTGGVYVLYTDATGTAKVVQSPAVSAQAAGGAAATSSDAPGTAAVGTGPAVSAPAIRVGTEGSPTTETMHATHGETPVERPSMASVREGGKAGLRPKALGITSRATPEVSTTPATTSSPIHKQAMDHTGVAQASFPDVREASVPGGPSPFGFPWAVERLSLRPSALANTPMVPAPYGAPPPVAPVRRPAWWVAAGIGPFRESRQWHGDDTGLVRSLQGTETPHYTTAAGLYTGWEWRGGWGISTGVEYSGARYDFRHLDRFQDRRDSVITHVVTFNSSVVGSFTDTVAVLTEVRRPIAAMNRYASVYIPVEGSWHRGWFRWHYGVRAGIALDHHTMRSGITLVNAPGGARSVDVGETDARTDLQLGFSVGLDLGYAFTERLALWASPQYGSGLFSLLPTDGSPHTITTRTGIRFRLAYTLRPKP